MKTCLVLELLSLLMSPSLLQAVWDDDVYCGRHFDDLFTASDKDLIPPAILTLYSPECKSSVEGSGLTKQTLPPQQHLVYAKHDYYSANNLIWYKLDESDNLKTRYQPRECPTYLYFDDGSYLSQPTDIYAQSSGLSVLQWVWSKFAVNIKIENKTNKKLLVIVTGKDPQQPFATIDSRDVETITVFISSFVVILSSTDLSYLYGSEISKASPVFISITEDTYMGVSSDVWLTAMKKQQERKSLSILQWRFQLAILYLRNFKQPIYFQKYTATGYQKGTIPHQVYDRLITFYHENQNQRRPEPGSQEPAINKNQVVCTMVQLTPELIAYVSESFQALMETWAGVPLRMTSLYGIREYYTGNILRDHVDIASTHVISVILQIAQDLNGQPDWDLEIIGYDGIRQNITLKPGEMILYESSTLIHGRPFPFKGNLFANAFLHYKPVSGWDWGCSEDGQYLLHKGVELDDMLSLVTPSMKKQMAKRKNHDPKTEATHSEL